MFKRILLFGLLNFTALALGGFFTGSGVNSVWYTSMEQAPWTPPGWVFGAAWTLIMICFSVYMAILWGRSSSKPNLIALYGLQLVLNIAWNPVFFYFHQIAFALSLILSLTFLVFYFLIGNRSFLGWQSLWVLPYALWLGIASSLNAYILIAN